MIQLDPNLIVYRDSNEEQRNKHRHLKVCNFINGGEIAFYICFIKPPNQRYISKDDIANCRVQTKRGRSRTGRISLRTFFMAIGGADTVFKRRYEISWNEFENFFTSQFPNQFVGIKVFGRKSINKDNNHDR